jgi:hypothetical protein
MIPKTKAASLVLTFMSKVVDMNTAKQCALIAVDEILEMVDETMQGFLDADIIANWKQVKIEIEKL